MGGAGRVSEAEPGGGPKVIAVVERHSPIPHDCVELRLPICIEEDEIQIILAHGGCLTGCLKMELSRLCSGQIVGGRGIRNR